MKKVKVIKERFTNGKMYIFEEERIEHKYKLYGITTKGTYGVYLETDSPYRVYAEHNRLKKNGIPCYVVNTITEKKIIEYK